MCKASSFNVVRGSGPVIRTGHFFETPSYRTVRPRGSPDWLLVYTISGCGRFWSPIGELPAVPGTLTLTEPCVYHDYRTSAGASHWELLWTHFQPRLHWGELLNWPRVSEGLMQLDIREAAQGEQIVSAFWEVHKIAVSGRPRREQFAMAALEQMLLWCDLANPVREDHSVDARVASAIEYICSHLDVDLSVERIAERACSSSSRFAHLFKQETGQSIQKYVEAQRIERAKQLLAATGRPVQSIAADIGYASPFYFSLRFKKRTGESPSRYRLRMVEEN